MPSCKGFDLVESLPIELSGLILQNLHFSSVHTFLKTYPNLKKHCLIINHPSNVYNYFDIHGVLTLGALPRSFKDHCKLKDRVIHLIMYNMTPNTFSQYTADCNIRDKTFNFPEFFSLLSHGPRRVMIHSSIPHNWRTFVYESNMAKLTNAGFKIIEKPFYVNYSGMTLTHTNCTPRWGEWNPCKPTTVHDIAGTFTDEGETYDCWFTRVSNYSNITFTACKTIIIEFPPSDTRPSLTNISFEGATNIHIRYHTLLPTIKNVTVKKTGTGTGQHSVFTLTDVDTERHDYVLPKEHCDVSTSDLDLSWVSQFTYVTVNGGPTSKLISLMDLGDTILSLNIRQTQPSRFEKNRLCLDNLQIFRFHSIVPHTVAPLLGGFKLRHLFLKSSAFGFSFDRCLKSLENCSLITLSIDTERDPKVQVLDQETMLSLDQHKSLKFIRLLGISSPWVEDGQLELSSLRNCELSLVRYYDKEMNPVVERYMSDCLELRGLGACFLASIDITVSKKTYRQGSWETLRAGRLNSLGYRIRGFPLAVAFLNGLRYSEKNPATTMWWRGPDTGIWRQDLPPPSCIRLWKISLHHS